MILGFEHSDRKEPEVAGASWELPVYRRKTKTIHTFLHRIPSAHCQREMEMTSALVRKSFGYRYKKQFRWTGFILYLIVYICKKVIGQLARSQSYPLTKWAPGTELRSPDLVKTILAYRAISLAQDWVCTRCSEFKLNATRVCQTPV